MDSTENHQNQNPVDSQKEFEEEAFIFPKNLASGVVLPMVIKTAIELDLLENMAKAGPPGTYVSPGQLATQLPTRNPDAATMIDRILRLLTSYSLLNSTTNVLPDGGEIETLYALAPLSKFLIKDPNHGMSLAPLLLFNLDKVFVNTWYHLKDAVLEGGVAFDKAYGMSTFKYNGTDARFNKVYNQAMSNHSTMAMKKILDLYHGFQGITTIVDVGGGVGGSLRMILSKHPTIKGINFDLPHVVQDATPFPGIEFVGGNMFENVPTGDAIFMKFIWHDWGDEDCLKFLKNCYEALPAKGKMIVAESIIPEPIDTKPVTKNILHVDLNMMAHYVGGKERTEKEFEALGKRAGFARFAKICCAFNTSIMEFYK